MASVACCSIDRSSRWTCLFELSSKFSNEHENNSVPYGYHATNSSNIFARFCTQVLKRVRLANVCVSIFSFLFFPSFSLSVSKPRALKIAKLKIRTHKPGLIDTHSWNRIVRISSRNNSTNSNQIEIRPTNSICISAEIALKLTRRVVFPIESKMPRWACECEKNRVRLLFNYVCDVANQLITQSTNDCIYCISFTDFLPMTSLIFYSRFEFLCVFFFLYIANRFSRFFFSFRYSAFSVFCTSFSCIMNFLSTNY